MKAATNAEMVMNVMVVVTVTEHAMMLVETTAETAHWQTVTECLAEIHGAI